eukprot:9953358-Ditylum_brightwellii.AAC.1
MMESDMPAEKDTILKYVFMDLKKNEDKIVVPMDKTNGHRLVAITNYIKWVNGCMYEAAIPIKREEIVNLHQDAIEFALTLNNLLNEDEWAIYLKT